MKTSRYQTDPDAAVVHQRTSGDTAVVPSRPSAQDWLDARESGARAILRRAGLPDSLRLVETSPGRFTGVLALVSDRPGTLEWYAAEVLRRVVRIREALERGDSAEALQAQQELGDLMLLGELEHGFGRALIESRRERRRKSEGGRQSGQRRRGARSPVRDLVEKLAVQERAAGACSTSASELARRIHARLLHPAIRRSVVGEIPAQRTIREWISSGA